MADLGLVAITLVGRSTLWARRLMKRTMMFLSRERDIVPEGSLAAVAEPSDGSSQRWGEKSGTSFSPQRLTQTGSRGRPV